MITLLAVFGMAILVVLFVYFLLPKLRLAYQLRKHKSQVSKRTGKKKQLDSSCDHLEYYEDRVMEIERANDMELYSGAGKFVVRM